jgi:hypothetical protein
MRRLAIAAALVTLASANAGYRQHVLQANLAMAGGPRQPVPYTQVCQLNLLWALNSVGYSHHPSLPCLFG